MPHIFRLSIPDDVYAGVLTYTSERDQTPECFVEALLDEWRQKEQECAKYDALFEHDPDWRAAVYGLA